MDLGIFTIAYNGYGRFAARWCEAIAASTALPSQVTIALFGDDNGLDDLMAEYCTDILPCLRIVHYGEHISIGADRNRAVKETPTEWIMLLDVDDVLTLGGLEEIERHANANNDVVAVAYIEEKLDGSTKIHLPPKIIIGEDLFQWRTHWISPYSPFRRFLWEKTPYIDGEFPNAPMVFSFVANKARWGRTDIPCAKHIRRENTHSARKSEKDRVRVYDLLDDYARQGLEAIQRKTIDVYSYDR